MAVNRLCAAYLAKPRYKDTGLYTGKKTLNDLIDQSYMDYALQRVGKQ